MRRAREDIPSPSIPIYIQHLINRGIELNYWNDVDIPNQITINEYNPGNNLLNCYDYVSVIK